MIAGRDVGAIGIGTARLSISDSVDAKASVALLNRAVDLGMNYLDTALAYTTTNHASHAESLVATVLSHRSDDVFVGTKGGHYRSGAEWVIDARPSSLRRNCDASLRALRLDAIDLYYLHFPDPTVPLQESMGALEELRLDGKIRAIGVCNVTLDQLETATKVAPVSAVQNLFSPFTSLNRDVLTACDDRKIPFVAASPLGGSHRPLPLDQLSPLATTFAEQLGVGIGTLWLAWMLRLSDWIIPVAGSGRPESLISTWKAASLHLTDEKFFAIESDLASRAKEKG
jgi:aryl-alcohol dehydrogenase-like predicted oxidoreductase